MIVAVTMLAVYPNQGAEERTSVAEYSHSLQSEILSDIVINRSLRLNVLNVVTDYPSDGNYSILNDFVASKVPDSLSLSP